MQYKKYSKIRYYLLFLYYKIRLPIDCRNGMARLLFAEFIHIFNYIFRTNIEMPAHDRTAEIETIFGKFKFIGDNYGYSILSPAFERPDKELFEQMMRGSIDHGKSILFLDIGAFVGDYCIGLYHRLKDKKFKTIAFEPDIDYYNLCLKNLHQNTVNNCTVYNYGLSNRSTTIRTLRFPSDPASKKLIFRLKMLDSIITKKQYAQFDEIYVKIDIEGHEEETFEGAKNLTCSGKKINLMIEDCVNPAINRYLIAHKWKFIAKITPYDSFWELN